MSPRTVPLATLLSVVPYFHTRGPVRVTDAARDLGMSEKQLRDALWQLWSCGLPGYGPGDLIDLAFSSEDLDDAEMVEVTFTAGIDRPVRLTAAEAVTLETGLAVFLGQPEVIDQTWTWWMARTPSTDVFRCPAILPGSASVGAPSRRICSVFFRRLQALRRISSDTKTDRIGSMGVQPVYQITMAATMAPTDPSRSPIT